ncbi:MAG: long-chain fatty acid--CoA ligase [Mycobacteriaceae bacterium]
MRGLMQDYPLTLDSIFLRAETLYADRALMNAGPVPVRTTYGQWAERTRRLGGLLDTLGISSDGRVATFAWNSTRHLELYFAAPCTGRVLHTLNIRLFPEQLAYVANHAGDEVVFVDRSLLGMLAPLLPSIPSITHVVVMDDGAGPEPSDVTITTAEVYDYEELLAQCEPVEFHTTDEYQAAAMCYTSGTTGNPKGVVYSHRSTWLHSMAAISTAGLGCPESDVILPIVPMFHANAWGLAHAAPMCGAGLVFPGSDMSPQGLLTLMVNEKVTIAAGVPTIWAGIRPLLEGADLSHLRAVVCGGSAVPQSLSEFYRATLGIPILQAWGMTETHPLATVAHLSSRDANLSEQDAAARRARQGGPVPGMEVRIVEPDTTEALPWDDEATGELQVRSPWAASDYYDPDPGVELSTPDGWMKTGDVAAIDPFGSVRLVDRTKDLVKSGGEWISSVELENEIMAHPGVAEAAVIGVPHPKWDERPIACVVRAEGSTVTAEELMEYLRSRVAKWWLPDAIEFIDEVPKTSVGKFSKKDLRMRFTDYVLPS